MDKIALRRRNLRAAIDAANKKLGFKSDVNFCEHFDLNPSHISQLINGHGSFGERAARNLEKKIGWEEGLLDKADNVIAKADPESSFSNVSFNDLQLRKIPVLDFVQAGIFNATNYDGIIPLSYTFTDYNGSNPDAIFSVVVTGKSMEPDFVAGDKLIIDAALSAKPGCFVIAQNGAHEATFKKFRVTGYDEHGRETFELVPLNPDFPTLSSKDHDITIIGVMVRHMRDYRY